jgi:hypothetical protein
MTKISTLRNYANGDCQILAAAIQAVTGWDVALFDGAGSHVTVVAPDGRHVDWHGARTSAEISAEWGAGEPEVVGHIDDLGWLGCGWELVDLYAAREALTRAGLLTDDIAETITWEIEKLED